MHGETALAPQNEFSFPLLNIDRGPTKWIRGPWAPNKKTTEYKWNMEGFLSLFSIFGILWEKRLQKRNIAQCSVGIHAMLNWEGAEVRARKKT